MDCRVLRGSQHAGQANLDLVEELAGEGVGEDRHGYRAELLTLVRQAAELRAMAEKDRRSKSK